MATDIPISAEVTRTQQNPAAIEQSAQAPKAALEITAEVSTDTLIRQGVQAQLAAKQRISGAEKQLAILEKVTV